MKNRGSTSVVKAVAPANIGEQVFPPFPCGVEPSLEFRGVIRFRSYAEMNAWDDELARLRKDARLRRAS